MVEQSYTDTASPSLRLSKKTSVASAQTIKDALIEQIKTGDRISELGETLQQDRVTQARDKIADFQKFKQEIGVAACRLQKQCDELRQKVRLRLFTDTLPEGVLTHDAEEYLDCLNLKQNKLDSLLNDDETHWIEKLREAKESMATFKQNLKALLERQTEEIEQALDLDVTKRKFTLRKLALWGEQVQKEQINFEWPLQDDMNWGNVSLQSLEMKSNASVLSSVRCVLSNGISSPVFENERVNHDSEQTILLGAAKVRYLQAHDEGGDNVCRIFLMDANRKDVAFYNPLEMKKKGALLKLRDEESLIGVYGVMGKKNYFTSFGFIVKAQEEETTAE